jgi:hypothetical protein
MSEQYNGWTNYATWRVNLEICDDYCGSLASDVENEGEARFESVSVLADQIKEFVGDIICGEDGYAEQLTTQYAMAFIDDVNWRQIADHWAEELIATEEEDE